MYSLLIADDELLSRQLVKTLIRRHCPEIGSIWEAENGKVALEMVKLHSPDILVLDVKMPILNGLETATLILEKDPTAMIIILTAYSDFEFIQQAINCGVMGYFLKPINYREITGKLSAICNTLSDQQSEKINKQDFDKSMKIIRPIVNREMVRVFIHGSRDTDDAKFYQEFLQYNIEGGYFLLLSLGFIPENMPGGKIHLHFQRERVEKIIPKVLAFWRPGLIGSFTSQIMPIFIPVPANGNSAFIIRESKAIAQELVVKIQHLTGIEMCVAIGKPYYDFSEFKLSFQEAFALIHQLSYGEIAYSGEQSAKNLIPPYPYQLEDELLHNIRLKRPDEITQSAEAMLHYLFSHLYDFVQTKEYFTQFLIVFRRGLREMGIGTQMPENYYAFQNSLKSLQTEEFEEYARQMVSFLCEIAVQHCLVRNLALSERIKKFIEENLANEISLDTLSQHVNLSSQYVSKLFKEEFGENFIDYLTRLRLQKAKELLHHSTYNISEICHQSGYLDQNYFCRIFKKHTGLTPKEFRKLRS